MDDAQELGARLFDLRSKAGYSQEQLGDMLGVSRQAISRWEGGQGKPELENIIKIAQIYRVSIDYVLTGEQPVSPISEARSAPVQRELPREYRLAISIVAVLAGAVILFALFIVVMSVFSSALFGTNVPGWS